MLPAAVQALRSQRSRSWRKSSRTPDEILWDFREGEYIPGGSKRNNIPNFFSEPHSGLSASVGMHRTLEQQGCPPWSTGPWTRPLWAENAKLFKVQNWSAEETAGKVDFDRSCVLYSKSYNHCRFQVNTPPSSFFFLCLKIMKRTDQGKIPKVFLQNLKPPMKKEGEERKKILTAGRQFKETC